MNYRTTQTTVPLQAYSSWAQRMVLFRAIAPKTFAYAPLGWLCVATCTGIVRVQNSGATSYL